MEQLQEYNRWCPRCRNTPCTCRHKVHAWIPLWAVLRWQDEICPWCNRTKKACSDAGGSWCDLR